MTTSAGTRSTDSTTSACRRRSANCSRECRDEPYRLLLETAARRRGAGVRAVARRARQAGVRERLARGVAAVARAPDDADQREPVISDGPETPRLPRRRDGEVPVRRRRTETLGLHARGLTALRRGRTRAAS